MRDTDNWVNSAINNTELVVNLLIKLRQSSPPFPLQKNWTVRQRRSLPPASSVGKKSPETRASPTTPLSYSGGATSVSGGGGEESSRVIHDGSKIIGPNETTPAKRPRKKKTLAELKEDETILIKERKQLKLHLATLQATREKRKKENESLKKIKIDLQSHLQPLTASKVNACTQGKKENGFVVPDLNFPAGEEY